MQDTRLNDFDPQVRKQALQELVAQPEADPSLYAPEIEAVNMHCHTFFSYNGYGYSPTALAWLGKTNGFQAMGIVDFDVLDGVDEFLSACDRVGVRASTGMETRVFVPEFATREINSPGEPGIFYHMGIGFTSRKVPAAVAADALGLVRRHRVPRQQVLLGACRPDGGCAWAMYRFAGFLPEDEPDALVIAFDGDLPRGVPTRRVLVVGQQQLVPRTQVEADLERVAAGRK